jgi:hypothetical protein
VFEEALGHPDWVVASRLADVPLVRLSDEEETRVTRLLVRVLQRPERDARLDLLKKARYLPLRDAERVLFSACLAHLAAENPAEATEALQVVLQRLVPAETERVATAIAELAPRRRTIAVLLDAVPAWLGPYAAPQVLEVARKLLAAIAGDEALVPRRIALAAPLLDWKELVALLDGISSRDLLHFDAMTEAVQAVKKSVHPHHLERELGSRSDPRLRRLGLTALLSAAKPKRGWSEERRERLRVYQDDPDPLVRGAAAFVFPPRKAKA